MLFVCHSAERFNKKCKNLTSNKNLPFESLANSLVRDATARYFRWKRSDSTTRVLKTPRTECIGTSKAINPVSLFNKLQCHLSCGCRIQHATVFSHSQALIGGKKFNPGEQLLKATRCSSVVTMVKGGNSIYGLVKRFLRVLCDCGYIDLVVVTWLPPPVYPDGDVLTVRIDVGGMNVNRLTRLHVVPLYDIQPSRIAVDVDTTHDCLYMMRLEGMDTSTTV